MITSRIKSWQRVASIAFITLLAACSSGGDSGNGDDVAIAYVKRNLASVGNPTDGAIFTAGGDLYMREKSSPSAAETNITGGYTQGRGDVSDPEVSFDGKKIVFAMRGPNDATWNIWEYDIAAKRLQRVIKSDAVANQGDDVDPAYLPDGRIVFTSNRQETSLARTGYAYLDEYERERTLVLHVMDPASSLNVAGGTNSSFIKQISFNQSHDRNPTVLMSGEIMFARWDHVGERNQFSIFTTNPDGTNMFVLYGAHSPGNSFLHPREMPDGRVLSTLMPLSGTREGGALMAIDVKNFSEDDEPAAGASGQGQQQVTANAVNFGEGVSEFGRYSSPYPLWDGTQRALVTFTPLQRTTETNPLTGGMEDAEGEPKYGIFMFDFANKTLRPVVPQQDGLFITDAVALQARPTPNPIPDKTLNATMAGRGVGILNVKSVYDTDGRGRMGGAVLVGGESIPMLNGVADIARLKDPALTSAAQRPARFVRIAKAVPTPEGISMEAIGETEFEMQHIVGYTQIEPDGSFKIEVPADTPLTITVLDADGRGFTPHTNWIQVRPGETRTCNGCHSPRRGTAINTGLSAADLNGTDYYHRNTVIGVPGASNPLGQSMAESRTQIFASALSLIRDIEYTDIWTDTNVPGATAGTPISLNYGSLGAHTHAAIPAPVVAASGATCNGSNWDSAQCAIVINFQEHIQPIFNNHCIGCHATETTANGNLNLSANTTGTGRSLSYQELLMGDPILDANNQPIVDVTDDGELRVRRQTPNVIPGESRASFLTEVLFNRELAATKALSPTRTINHETHAAASLTLGERRLIAEWIDLGAQYYNTPFDSGGAVRGVRGLDEDVFETAVHPILRARCMSCHGAVGTNGTANPNFQGKRYVLTGSEEGDFNMTAAMVNRTDNPALSYLLQRPASDGGTGSPVHPRPNGQAILSPTSADTAIQGDYRTLCNWIGAANMPAVTCP